MKKILLIAILFFSFLNSPSNTFAASNPLSKPNNFFGIHILSTNELAKSSELVNTSGGDWGYVAIPIQVGDKDIEKWQKFMNDAYDLHLIPILRLATESYHKETSVWRKPTEADILDFANFLNSLHWPTKNRYVILFNEVNRYDEWGGEAPDPARYAEIAEYAADVFKSTNSDFYVILGGLDNAAPNMPNKYIDNLVFLRLMHEARPDVFNKIDAFSSHSYPNPNFADSPNTHKADSVVTYRFEASLIDSYTSSKKPIFITETGWNGDVLSSETISSYFTITFSSIWGKDVDRIVAITPFLLESQNGQYDKFSFLHNNQFTSFGKTIQNISKIKGAPETTPPPLLKQEEIAVLGIRDFRRTPIEKVVVEKFDKLVAFYFKSLFGI
jgi:hypothetical protein